MRLPAIRFIRRYFPSKSETFPSALRVAALVLLLAALAGTGGCSRPRGGTLTVGMELAYPPFEMRDAQGNPSGVSPDLARALGEYLHEPVAIENIPFSGLIPALRTGKIDLIISSMTQTPERARSIDFSEPYLSTGLCLLVRKDSPVRDLRDLDRAGVKIAVKQGTTGQTYAREHLKEPELLVLDKETECVLEVVQGKASAFIYDQMSTYSNWRNNPDTTRAILTPFQAESWAIGIRQGNDELRTKVNAFLAAFKARGGFEELGNRYLPAQKAAFREMNVPFVF